MAKACRNRILEGGDTNYYIFLNSIEDINKIIVGAEILSPQNTRIICSTSSKDKLLPGFSIGNAADSESNPMPVNFLTSTCFEGQDIYDPIGEPIIVCDGWKKHTMVDISTSLIQIAGRIRKSKYTNHVTQVLSLSNYQVVMTAEEYEKDVMQELAREQAHVDWMNSCPADLIDSFLKQIPYLRKPYVQIRDKQIILDKGLAYQDIVNFKIVHLDYGSCVNLEKKMRQNGVVIDDSVSVHDGGILKAMPAVKRATFKEMFIRYCEIMEAGKYSLIENEELVEIRTQRPLVIEAYNKLGPEKVKAMKYHISNIRDAITQMTNTKEDYKIVEMLKRALPMMQ